MDKRGLAALCARASFGAPHYIALRIALDLAEQGVGGADPEIAYSAEAITFVQQQYDRIRCDRAQLATCSPTELDHGRVVAAVELAGVIRQSDGFGASPGPR
jgi:hypothetical protein